MRKFLPFLFCSCLFLSSMAQPTISFQSFLTGLAAPIEVVNAGDGSNRLFVVQQNGIVRVYDPANGGLQSTPFLDMSSRVRHSGEQGLLSMAFHPEYETNGYFFVYYNNTAGEITLARYRVSSNSNIADGGSGTVLLTISKPFTNHNGGHLQFGQDGYLYFATGDGGGANDPGNNAQDSTSLLGKMIRIDVNEFNTSPYYTIPSSNPFVGNPLVNDHIWALGLRNPFRWSFDRLTGDMWIGDVGQGAKEEINYRPASSTGGENYGWRCYEGSIRNPNLPHCDPVNHVPPIFEYNNPADGRSVIGGYVYRGNEYTNFQGWYIATDAYSRAIFLIRPNGSGGWTAARQAGTVNFIVGFGEAEDGTLYAVSLATNTLYKVVAAADATLPLVLQQFSGKALATGTELRWTTTSEEPNTKFVVEYSTDGLRYTKAGEVAATGAANGNSYSFVHSFTAAAPLHYRLLIVEANGRHRYSSIVKIAGRSVAVQVYPTVVRNREFFINRNEPIEQVQVLNSSGLVVLQKRVAQVGSPVTVQLPPLARGFYFVIVGEGANSSRHQIVVE